METSSRSDQHGVSSNTDCYPEFLQSLRNHVARAAGPLFRTDAEALFDAFLAALPSERRQEFTCSACRRFVDRYGDLAEISPEGTLRSVLWGSEGVPEFFRPAVGELERRVTRANVRSVFITSTRVWGTPVKGPWEHMAVTPATALVYEETVLKNAGQAAAEKLEEYGMLQRGLEEFPRDLAIKAKTLLKSGNLYRSEKAVAIAEWFANVHDAFAATKGRARQNVAWLAVAKAPAGFSHIKASMIGTLLDDLNAGLPFEDIQGKWSRKMDPLQYMRPQALPTKGNIAQGEKVVAALRSAGALERRFARLEDLENQRARVTDKQGVQTAYSLDRWD